MNLFIEHKEFLMKDLRLIFMNKSILNIFLKKELIQIILNQSINRIAQLYLSIKKDVS